jgi:hypothetical protein
MMLLAILLPVLILLPIIISVARDGGVCGAGVEKK